MIGIIDDFLVKIGVLRPKKVTSPLSNAVFIESLLQINEPKKEETVEPTTKQIIEPLVVRDIIIKDAKTSIKEIKTMAFSFSSIGHALSTGLHDAYKGMQVVEDFVAKFSTTATATEVESLTALIPVYGPKAVVIERGVFAVAGELASILSNLTTNGEAKLLDAGFDATVIADFKALIASVPNLFSLSSAATTPTPASKAPAAPAVTPVA